MFIFLLSWPVIFAMLPFNRNLYRLYWRIEPTIVLSPDLLSTLFAFRVMYPSFLLLFKFYSCQLVPVEMSKNVELNPLSNQHVQIVPVWHYEESWWKKVRSQITTEISFSNIGRSDLHLILAILTFYQTKFYLANDLMRILTYLGDFRWYE